MYKISLLNGMDDKDFFCIHNMLLIQVQKTYHNTCTQLCVMANVFTNTPEVTYRLILSITIEQNAPYILSL